MKQTIALLLTLLPYNAPFLSQEGARSNAQLVHRYERACGYSCLQELAIELGGIRAAKPDDTVAVRFCSQASLPVALVTAAAAPDYLISILTDAYGYTPERILFLRSGDCRGPNKRITATEFWAIPKGAPLPASVESIKSSQVRSEAVGKEASSALGTPDYRAAARELTATLSARPQAVGIVIGYYYRSPTRIMKRRLREVRAILEKSGLSQGRYYVSLMPWTGERSIDPPEPEAKYPRLLVVLVSTLNRNTD